MSRCEPRSCHSRLVTLFTVEDTILTIQYPLSHQWGELQGLQWELELGLKALWTGRWKCCRGGRQRRGFILLAFFYQGWGRLHTDIYNPNWNRVSHQSFVCGNSPALSLVYYSVNISLVIFLLEIPVTIDHKLLNILQPESTNLINLHSNIWEKLFIAIEDVIHKTIQSNILLTYFYIT